MSAAWGERLSPALLDSINLSRLQTMAIAWLLWTCQLHVPGKQLDELLAYADKLHKHWKSGLAVPSDLHEFCYMFVEAFAHAFRLHVTDFQAQLPHPAEGSSAAIALLAGLAEQHLQALIKTGKRAIHSLVARPDLQRSMDTKIANTIAEGLCFVSQHTAATKSVVELPEAPSTAQVVEACELLCSSLSKQPDKGPAKPIKSARRRGDAAGAATTADALPNNGDA